MASVKNSRFDGVKPATPAEGLWRRQLADGIRVEPARPSKATAELFEGRIELARHPLGLDLDEIVGLIRDAGKVPVERDSLYNPVREPVVA